MKPAYYNEIEPHCAQWIRNLMAAGEISDGYVDERSIRDVSPDDLVEFGQVHLFAGIAGWSRALKLAGWPDDKEVWTGSCPCQPFSTAGNRKGTDDDRHLWPEFYRLIAERRPSIVFGEQVASPLGRDWLAGVRSDLEGVGYAVGAADLCSAGIGETALARVDHPDHTFEWIEIVIGAPHIRQRLWWGGCLDLGVVHPESSWRRGRRSTIPQNRNHKEFRGPDSNGRLGDANNKRLAERERNRSVQQEALDACSRETFECGSDSGFWSSFTIIPCADGKARRIPQSTFLGMVDGLPPDLDAMSPEEGFPLAKGVKGRIGALRGFGNAINPFNAAEFVKAFAETIEEM